MKMATPLPPQRLALAPGDGVTLSTTVSLSKDVSPNPRDPLPGFRLVAVVRRADKTTRRSAPVFNVTTIENRILSGGVTAADDGAVAYVEVSRTACTETSGLVSSTEDRVGGATTLSVSAANLSLVNQDTEPPNMVRGVYPPTVMGLPVTVTVSANNRGGGRRRVGNGTRPTGMTYRWYTRPRGPLELVAETTQPSLYLPSARPSCFARHCSRENRNKCGDIRRVLVAEVCNTAGCVRTDNIAPAILRPNWELMGRLSTCAFVD
ncbi:hypothetical protein BU14_0112s0012 [Porphyra umbilicalis]|uniref:Uncharacterized protein n=1 Tax=Porphyra umbilicalis TaxID=2786 RepID=A0A1X6PCC7_PORUM|nr:hypothetical protein BU14_0112s0012 [Porphyra umbilicalis]|eukprot:OSX78313.1 hypothetical protein BU14_0112s0012 [Porphyra umbilicalis]